MTNVKDDIMGSLNKMRLATELCDIAIITNENERHLAHSVILAAASPVFKAMMSKGFQEYHSRVCRFI